MRSRPEIVVGVIGSGWIVRAHVHALHTLNHLGPLPARVRLKWIYGRRPEKMAALADELEIERFSVDWQEIIDDPEVDVVANAGTHLLHAPVSLAAIAAGKHVLCEKPLALDSGEASEMAGAAERADVFTACGFNYRFVPAIRLLHQLLADGRLGEVRHFRGLYLQDWLSNNPDWPGSAGSAVRHFSHLFDMLRHLAGEPVSVVGSAKSILSDEDDTFLGGFELANGATASLEGSSCATGWKGRNRIETQLHRGLGLVGHGGVQQAPRDVHRGPAPGGRRLPRRPRHRARPSVRGRLVGGRSGDRLAEHLRPPVAGLPPLGDRG